MMALFIFLAFSKTTRKLGIAAIASSVMGLVISRIVRWVAPRERPFIALEEVSPLIEKEASASFPSEQALIVGIFIALLWLMENSFKWTGIFLGSMILVSRVYLGHHYVSDVVIGAVLGISLFVTTNKLSSRKPRFPQEKSLTS
ncbi:phosphatase PAP2 family protein [Halobacillus sp. HZG1]|uniref:phosphatase PAP2 family protein n=1 Tax=Halobacillus sp. HZG1 TaxID=3111769 RepID=UPI003FA37CDF